MRASWFSSSSRTLRASSRMVLRSSRNSTCAVSASASLTTWASLFTLSRLSLNARPQYCFSASPQEAQRKPKRVLNFSVPLCLCGEKNFSQDGLVLLDQLALHFPKHFLIVGPAATHLVGVCFEDDAHLVIDPVFERHFFQ